jgi:hypothetical protein
LGHAAEAEKALQQATSIELAEQDHRAMAGTLGHVRALLAER